MVMGSTDKEVKYGKPHPDIFLVAAARFPDKPHPSKVCYDELICWDMLIPYVGICLKVMVFESKIGWRLSSGL